MSALLIRAHGHFGELMQGRIGPHGPLALISLPCPVLSVTGFRVQNQGLAVHGAGQRLLTAARARAFLHQLGLPVRGRFILRASMPVGGGAGASTAALVALARAAGWVGAAGDLARACLAVEGATDPLMFTAAERMLWASRRAALLEDLPALPPFEVIGGFFGPGQRTDPADGRFPDIADLLPDWRQAAVSGDLPRLARLAATSARRTLSLRGTETDPIPSLADRLGALGYVIAHTGAARGLIFAPGAAPAHVGTALRDAGLRGVVRFRAGGAM